MKKINSCHCRYFEKQLEKRIKKIIYVYVRMYMHILSSQLMNQTSRTMYSLSLAHLVNELNF